jgi:hypothetical protein
MSGVRTNCQVVGKSSENGRLNHDSANPSYGVRLDVVAVSFFNDWKDRRRQSLVWLENDGQQRFTMRPLSNSPTDLPTDDLGDFNGDGRLDIIAGGLTAGRPEALFGPARRRTRLARWTNRGVMNDGK